MKQRFCFLLHFKIAIIELSKELQEKERYVHAQGTFFVLMVLFIKKKYEYLLLKKYFLTQLKVFMDSILYINDVMLFQA